MRVSWPGFGLRWPTLLQWCRIARDGDVLATKPTWRLVSGLTSCVMFQTVLTETSVVNSCVPACPALFGDMSTPRVLAFGGKAKMNMVTVAAGQGADLSGFLRLVYGIGQIGLLDFLPARSQFLGGPGYLHSSSVEHVAAVAD